VAGNSKVQIVQRNLHPHTNSVQALTIIAHYGDGVEAEATILLRPGAVPNDEKNIQDEIARLGVALIAAARSPNGITS
jgi:hypothetical protein